ncbi:secretory component protein Shr3p [[Candida] anglica]|uniref:Secretory component protein Shr3p n=1 Tax=[Candida] anglica TaxID=148631 RepID=A0ABP0E5G1_9ASCO
MAYKDIVPIGSSLIIAAASFGLGAVYGNWPYDLNTLFIHDPTGNSFNVSLAHYMVWANAPNYIHHTLHAVFGFGLLGCFIKLYKPDEEAKYFEYGSLGLLMVSIIIYLTNLRTGINSCVVGNWGDVDMATGINVMAASQIMIVLALVGVLFLQGGLYYAQWYDNKIKVEFYEREAELAAKARETAAASPSATEVKVDVTKVEPTSKTTTTGSAKSNSKAKKRTK